MSGKQLYMMANASNATRSLLPQMGPISFVPRQAHHHSEEHRDKDGLHLALTRSLSIDCQLIAFQYTRQMTHRMTLVPVTGMQKMNRISIRSLIIAVTCT